ncbi:MAG: hypothetical protein JW871_05255 [Endomicrobiales bacterium]|nr:hypothetical protein [Endomicrobiales bacterium]
MLKKLVRILLIFSGLVFLIFAVFFVSFKLLFTQQRLKKIFADFVRGGLNCELVADKVSFSFISGFELKDFQLYKYSDYLDKNKSTKEKAKPFFTAKRAVIKGDMFPFLQSRVKLNEICIESFNIRDIEEGTFKKFKESMLLKSFSRRMSKVPKNVSKMYFISQMFSISDFKMTNGELDLKGLFKSEKLTLKNIDLSARNVSFSLPFKLELSFSLEKDKKEFDISLECSIDAPNQRLVIEKGLLKRGNSSITILGGLQDFIDIERFSFSFDIKGDDKIVNDIFGLTEQDIEISFSEADTMSVNVSGNLDEIRIK